MDEKAISPKNWATKVYELPKITEYRSEGEQRSPNEAPSQYAAVPMSSPSTEKKYSRVQVQLHPAPEEYSMPVDILTNETENAMMCGIQHHDIPKTGSWPSITSKMIGSDQTTGTDFGHEQLSYKRLSSNCDSGYSEPEVFLPAQDRKDDFKIISLETMYVEQISFDYSPKSTSDKETQTELHLIIDNWERKRIGRYDYSFYLNIISEADSEDEYFREIEDMSLTSVKKKTTQKVKWTLLK